MIQDQINFCSNNQNLRVKCYLCHNPNHSVNECHLLHYKPDREKIIKSHDFYLPQQRKFIARKILKKTRYKIYKPISTKNTNFMFPQNIKENDESSSSGSNSEQKNQSNSQRDEYLNKESNVLLGDLISNRSNKSSEKKLKNFELFTTEFLEQKALNLNKTRKSLGNLEPISPNSKRNLIISKEKSKFGIKWEPTESENQSNEFAKSKRRLSDINEQKRNSCFRQSNDDIDQIKQFKKYFPQNNFSNIILVFSKNSLKMSKKKKVELQRISNYTFYLDLMYRILKKARRSSKKRSIQNTNDKKADEKIKITEGRIQKNSHKREKRKEIRRKYSLTLISSKILGVNKKKFKIKSEIFTPLYKIIEK